MLAPRTQHWKPTGRPRLGKACSGSLPLSEIPHLDMSQDFFSRLSGSEGLTQSKATVA